MYLMAELLLLRSYATKNIQAQMLSMLADGLGKLMLSRTKNSFSQSAVQQLTH